MRYDRFLNTKKIVSVGSGIDIELDELSDVLFPFQKLIVRWSLKRGKAAIFASTGLGKTLMQLEYANIINFKFGYNVLIIAPLAVSSQTIEEAKKLDLFVNNYRKKGYSPGINIINYEYLDHVDPSFFSAIILDESSIIKSFSGKIKKKLFSMFKNCEYKLACTATPAPNDYMELGSHAEFLDIMKYREMLSIFFNHDGGNTSKWKIKNHAVNDFWEWVASWGAVVNHPRDLGFDDKRFDLPELNFEIIKLHSGIVLDYGFLNRDRLTMSDRMKVRKKMINDKIEVLKNKLINNDDIFLVWCDYNNEADVVEKEIDDCVQIAGRHSIDYKEKNMLDFADGKIKRLVTKPKMFGFGMNWQICHNQIFFGLSDSFESFYQAIRRCWRFGQKNNVNVYILTSDIESPIFENIKRKMKDYEDMCDSMKDKMIKYVKKNLNMTVIDDIYEANKKMQLPNFLRS